MTNNKGGTGKKAMTDHKNIGTDALQRTQPNREQPVEVEESLEPCGLGVQEVCAGTGGILLLSVGQLTVVRESTAEERGAKLAGLPQQRYGEYARRAGQVMGEPEPSGALFEVLSSYCASGAAEALRLLQLYQDPQDPQDPQRVSVLLRCGRRWGCGRVTDSQTHR